MLSTTERPAGIAAAGLVRYGYWTEAVGFHAQADDLARVISLGSHVASTPRLAMRWLHRRAVQITEQMKPESAWRVVTWLRSADQLESALAVIAAGGSYLNEFTDAEDGARYALTVRRITAPPITSSLDRLEPIPHASG